MIYEHWFYLPNGYEFSVQFTLIYEYFMDDVFFYGIDYDDNNLNEEEREYLASLPESVFTDIEERAVEKFWDEYDNR